MDNILYHSNHQPPKISLPLHNAIISHQVTWKCDLQIVKIALEIDGKRCWNAVKRITFLSIEYWKSFHSVEKRSAELEIGHTFFYKCAE